MIEAALFIGTMGPTELTLVVAAIVLLFGASKIPELARSLGEAEKEFKQAREEAEQELEEARHEPGGAGDPDDLDGENLREAAQALGVDTEGKSPEELREAIKAETD
jgi:sec-independent protein translocase protein TatA